MTIKHIFATAAMALQIASATASSADVIKLNQVGYYPSQEKVIVVEGTSASKCKVTDANGKTVLNASRKTITTSPISGKKRSTFDLSAIKVPGEYTVKVGSESIKMVVSENALDELSKAGIKSFYYQRTGIELTSKYAGKWARPAGHPDTNVQIHPAAATAWRPTGTVVSSPKGWYDAGDYNKYTVNSAFSMGLMLSMYETIPDFFNNQKVDIPEQDNKTADLLDENYWNLDWLFTMQDIDGGVYHKLTDPNFDPFVMPAACHQQRYMTAKSVTGTLDFAAIMAKCARIYACNIDYPGTDVRCINAARRAYEWAKANPKFFYNQDQIAKEHKPAITTGTYGDGSANDEFFWAAVELYLATGEESYLRDAQAYAPKSFSTPGWGMVAALGTYALLNAKNLPADAQALANAQKENLIAYAKSAHIDNIASTSFYSPYGNAAKDFFWGCNAEGCCAQGVSFLYAYLATSDAKYLKDAFRNCDYILGRNATGYCYVTGFGTKSPMHPHHRLSEADGVEEPIPGLLVGGPNPGQQDKNDGAKYTSDVADESYSDTMPSYASNEIAINWSASLVALISGLIGIK